MTVDDLRAECMGKVQNLVEEYIKRLDDLRKEYDRKIKELEENKETRQMTKIRSLKKGDTIKCHDKEEMINLMYELQKENIETDFIYEKDGVKGLWLIVTNVVELADTTNTKI